MILYLSGPMSGYPDYNRGAFSEAEKVLNAQHYSVVNPGALPDLPMMEGKKLWHRYLRRDIKLLMGCDAVVLLDGWEVSDGARLENYVAFQLGMPSYRLLNDKLKLNMHWVERAEKMG